MPMRLLAMGGVKIWSRLIEWTDARSGNGRNVQGNNVNTTTIWYVLRFLYQTFYYSMGAQRTHRPLCART